MKFEKIWSEENNIQFAGTTWKRTDVLCSLPYEKGIIFDTSNNHTGLGSMVWFVCSVDAKLQCHRTCTARSCRSQKPVAYRMPITVYLRGYCTSNQIAYFMLYLKTNQHIKTNKKINKQTQKHMHLLVNCSRNTKMADGVSVGKAVRSKQSKCLDQ